MMKKFLLSLIALLGVVSANAQVETTDVSDLDYAIYAESIEAAVGTTAKLPIYMKNAETVASLQFSIILPGDLADNYSKAGLNEARFDPDNGGTVFDTNKQDDGSVMIIATVLHDDGFNVGDAPILYLNLPISATMELGEYPIIIKATELSGVGSVASRSEKITAEITSKLTINDYLTLDENSVVAPASAEGINVKVKRTIKAGEWATLCLPFDMWADQVEEVFGADAQFAMFTGYTKDGSTPSARETFTAQSIKLNFTTQDWVADDGIFANTPYLVKLSNDVEEFTLENVDVNPTDVDAQVKQNGTTGRVCGHFYGTQYAGQVIPANGLFLSGGDFYYSKGKTKIKGFRGYFVLNDVLADMANSGVKMEVVVDGTTKIDNIRFADAAGAVYTVDGKFIGRDVDLKKLQKGIYVVDGKKVAIK